MAGAKKVGKTKNHIFHACQPREEIFEIPSYRGLIFMIVCLSFYHSELFPSDFYIKIIWPHKFILTWSN